MRRTLAVLAAITIAACTDTATIPVVPDAPPEASETYTGIDAYRMVVVDLKKELGNPFLLDLGAAMTGQTAEQRQRQVEELVTKFEYHIATYDAPAAMAASSSRCAKNPSLDETVITIVDRPPMWDDFGALVTVRPFTSSDGGAILGNDLWVVHGRNWPSTGAPPINGERQWSESYESYKCETEIYEHDITFDPEFRPGYVWAHNIHRLTNYWTGAEETRTTELGPIFLGKKKVIDPPVL